MAWKGGWNSLLMCWHCKLALLKKWLQNAEERGIFRGSWPWQSPWQVNNSSWQKMVTQFFFVEDGMWNSSFFSFALQSHQWADRKSGWTPVFLLNVQIPDGFGRKEFSVHTSVLVSWLYALSHRVFGPIFWVVYKDINLLGLQGVKYFVKLSLLQTMVVIVLLCIDWALKNFEFLADGQCSLLPLWVARVLYPLFRVRVKVAPLLVN